MTDVIYLSLRIGFLVLLWLFIFAALLVMKTDLRRASAKSVNSLSKRQEKSVLVPARTSSSHNPLTPSAIKVISADGNSHNVPLLSSPFTIGRSENADITLDDNFASGKHARFYYNSGCWFIEDTGSTNGTFMNNERLTSPIQVAIGAKINIGKTTLEII